MIDPDQLPHVDLEKLELSPAQLKIRQWQHAMDQIALSHRYPTRQSPVGHPLPPRKLQIVKR
jgi:hypothetical protein